MLARADFVFSIGYSGTSLVVDKSLKTKYRHLSTAELLEKGMYRAAICSAIYEQDDAALSRICEVYSKHAAIDVVTPQVLLRIFGVGDPPSKVQKIVAV